MKSFRFCIILGLCLTLVPATSYGQASAAFKAARKGVTTVLGKKAAKESAEKVAKEGVEAVVEKGAKTAVKNNVEKRAAATVVKNGVEAIGAKEAKAVLKQGVEGAANMTVKKSVGKAVAKEGVEYAATRIVKKEASGGLAEGALKASMREVGHNAARKMSTEAAEEVSERLVREMGQSMMEYWRKIVPDAASDANRVLLRDLSEDATFRRLICGTGGKGASPQLLEAYAHTLDAPSARTRADVLRYLSNGADLYHSKGVYRKTVYGMGKDLRLVEHDGIIHVYKEGSATCIGKMKPNRMGGFDIEVPFEDRTMLNLYAMKNSSYTTVRNLGDKGYVNLKWTTDEFGRTKEIVTVVKPDGKFAPLKRDQNAIQSVGRIKKDNTIHGQTPNRPTYINDDSGHMSALQCGGTNDAINLLSQNASLNKGAWKVGEDAARKSIQKGKTVTRRIEVNYADKVDLRPSSFVVNQSVDGTDTIVNQFFENAIEVVAN